MTCGIYEIVNTVNGKRYVGSSVNIERRFTTHMRELRKGTHHAGHLQNSYNKYGPDVYVINVLLECEPEELIGEEQKELDKGFDYNSSPTAGNTLGYKFPEHIKKKISNKRKDMYKTDPSFRDHVNNMSRMPKSEEWKRNTSERMLGSTKSNEQVDNMAKARAELTMEKVLEVRNKRHEGFSLNEISKITGVSWSQCQRICSGGRYTWAYNEGGPIEHDKFKNMRGSNSNLHNPKKYQFFHDIHGHRNCTQLELRNEFADLRHGHISSICSGNRRSHKGWIIKKAP